jgi:hypothetical protein
VKFHGKDAREIQPLAEDFARKRIIKEYFDKLILRETDGKEN